MTAVTDRLAAAADPYDVYRQWRDEQPIWWDATDRRWVLSRHDDVKLLLTDHARFSSQAMSAVFRGRLQMLTDDPPVHTTLRGLVSRAFTPRRVREWAPLVDDVSRVVVSRLPDFGSVEVMADLAVPLPVAVMSRIMDIPEERSEDFKRWSDALAGTISGQSLEARAADAAEAERYFAELVAERRQRPGHGLVDDLVTAEAEDVRLSVEDIVGVCKVLLIGGNETTGNLIANLLDLLARRPDLWERLRSDPSLVPAVIEEMLRFESPVQLVLRMATEDVPLHGEVIRAGQWVVGFLGSGNRDPRVFDAPDEFRLDRPASPRHIAFGHGIHHCLGASLARMEAEAVLPLLLSRYSAVIPGGGGRRRVDSIMLRAFDELWLDVSKV